MRRFVASLAAGLVFTAGPVTPPAAGDSACTRNWSAYLVSEGSAQGPASDPLFARQWGLKQIKAPQAWARGAKGRGATIAIVDTGVDLTHPDLKRKLEPGTDLTEGGGNCPGAQDENGHGTIVAGIAAAATGNGVGVAGTAPAARILPVRVLNSTVTSNIRAVLLGVKHAADKGADVINVSIAEPPVVGQSELLNEEVEGFVDYAFEKGAVVVGAAGHAGSPLCSYPAASKRAVCVGAVDRRGLPAAYSNFPTTLDKTVGLRAPGGESGLFCESDADIWSTALPRSSFDCAGGNAVAAYDTAAGTSMAAPYVSGVAAILAGRGLKAREILECLRRTSSNEGTYDPVMGYGVVDAEAAVSVCSPPHVRVTVLRTTRQRLARSGRLRLYIEGDGPVSVRLRAFLVRGQRSTLLARGRIVLRRADTRHFTLRLDRRARRAVARKHGRVRVRYWTASESGIASPGR